MGQSNLWDHGAFEHFVGWFLEANENLIFCPNMVLLQATDT